MIDPKVLAVQVTEAFGTLSTALYALRRAIMEFGRGGSVPVDPVHRDVNPVAGSNADGPSKIFDRNPRRARVVIRALKSNANTIELGNSRAVVYGRGIPLEPGETYSEEVAAFKGEWWAVAPNGAAVGANGVRAIEQLFAEGE